MALTKTFVPEVGAKFGGKMQKRKPTSSAPAPKPNHAVVIGYEAPFAPREAKQTGFVPPEQKESIQNNTALDKPSYGGPNKNTQLPENKAVVIGYETPMTSHGEVFVPPVQKVSVQNSTVLKNQSTGGKNAPVEIPANKAVVIGKELPQVHRDTKQTGFVPTKQHNHPTVVPNAGTTAFKSA